MNFLQICQFVHRRIGAGSEFVGTTPLDVTVPFGPLAEIVASVNDAYKDIQAEQNAWAFRTKQGTAALSSSGTVRDNATLSKAEIQLQITDYERMLPFVAGDTRYIRVYDPAAGVATATFCYYLPYQRWRGWRDFGAASSGCPGYYTFHPDEKLEVYPAPSLAYTLSFDYLATCDVLTGNAAEPIFPSEWHEAIAWRAVQYWGMSRKDSAIASIAAREYERIMNALRRTELPEPLLNLTAYYG